MYNSRQKKAKVFVGIFNLKVLKNVFQWKSVSKFSMTKTQNRNRKRIQLQNEKLNLYLYL